MHEQVFGLAPWIRQVFERLHRIPELDRDLPRTIACIEHALDEIGIAHERCAGGVLARLPGRTGSPVLALRADIDALPVTECSGLPYASEHAGCMHACGHDAHAAMALGALKALARVADRPRSLVVLFQPAEETDGGAARMIEKGAIEGVSRALCLHVAPSLRSGTFGVKSGQCRGASDMFDITLKGAGSHGAYPHLGKDTIVAGAQLVSALQAIVSRETDPLDSAVVTVGEFHAGTARNVVSEQCLLRGIVRTLSPASRNRVRGRIEQMARSVADMNQMRADVVFRASYPALINDPEVTDDIAALVQRLYGAGCVVRLEHPQMGVDDFAYISETVPSTYVDLGCTPAGSVGEPLHSPRFVVDPECLAYGAGLIASWVMS